ncbi:nucleotidyltransferase domain-containing protein [Pyrobaculum aerophilum]|nr:MULTISPECIES: nucleotidyltransferase domain-containing protein [Pyrobaculum]
MALDKWIEIAKAREGEIRARVKQYITERCPSADVVLFGSRARGDYHALSDWDLAIITPAGKYAVVHEEFGQAVYLPLSALNDILTSSMLILDIAHDGVLLCGKGDYWHILLKKVKEYVSEKGLIRTREGWYPAAAEQAL